MAVQITRPHTLGKQQARAVVQEIAASLQEKLHLDYAWDGDRLTFKRTGLSGHIEVAADYIDVSVKRSRLLPVSESWIREQVEAVMNEHLGAL